MPKPFVPKIVSANRLLDGRTVYLGPNGWSTDIEEAMVAENAEAAQELLDVACRQPGVVVGPYLVDVEAGDAGVPRPLEIREKMRLRGPSIAIPRRRGRRGRSNRREHI